MGVTDQMVCFALYSAARSTARAYRTLLAPWGLTYPQYLLLVILWSHGEQSVRSLGQMMQLDSGTLSPLVRRLEQGGLVERRRDSDDERVVTVALTDRGAALRQELAHIPGKISEAMGVTDAEQAAGLIRSLHEVCDSTEQMSRRSSADGNADGNTTPTSVKGT
ncbi:MAG: MarR family transcriptional regulator [Corynebacterium provencense]|jgi:DNA-binding MarR family transcriptional regulator|nr:MarR family transcriptional regulator [Corynebacterium provencense]